jgi:xanthine dehydrogenase small subunit
MRDHIVFYLNGAPRRVSGRDAFESLSRYLRYDQRATGTKIVCEEGDCGACTVLVGRREHGKVRYRAINSCIQFLFQFDGAQIVTVEGLAKDGVMTPVQDAMVKCHGAQCGYCTPGFIMAMTAMFEEGSRDARKALTGNLCRCTGYEPIIKAANECDVAKIQPIDAMYPWPLELDALAEEAVRIDNFFKPATLAEAIEFKAANPKCVIVQGATDFGVWCNKRGFVPEAVMSLGAIAGLGDITKDGDTIRVGGRVTLAAFEEYFAKQNPSLAVILDRFGSPQIKNAGTLAGNIANASPIADTLPFLYVIGARLELTGLGGTRVVPIESFYRGYKTLDLAPDEIITTIVVPMDRLADVAQFYKVSKRSHLDISSFTAAFLMSRNDGRIGSIRIAYGGVGPVVLRLPRTESFLTGKPFVAETFEQAGAIARAEIAPIDDVRGSRDFRLQLAENVLCKFFHDAAGAA